jgi:hypothetical protein
VTADLPDIGNLVRENRNAAKLRNVIAIMLYLDLRQLFGPA